MKIYTKGGDSGTTSLVGGERTRKDDPRVEAYGEVDELTAFIALLTDKISAGSQANNQLFYQECCRDLERINYTLMNIEAHLAAGSELSFKLPEVNQTEVEWLEGRIDALEEPLPKIFKFTLPGGDERVSLCHVCRTISRRCERRIITAADSYAVDAVILCYVNRLSDYLYTLGRAVTLHANIPERVWVP